MIDIQIVCWQMVRTSQIKACMHAHIVLECLLVKHAIYVPVHLYDPSFFIGVIHIG